MPIKPTPININVSLFNHCEIAIQDSYGGKAPLQHNPDEDGLFWGINGTDEYEAYTLGEVDNVSLAVNNQDRFYIVNFSFLYRPGETTWRYFKSKYADRFFYVHFYGEKIGCTFFKCKLTESGFQFLPDTTKPAGQEYCTFIKKT